MSKNLTFSIVLLSIFINALGYNNEPALTSKLANIILKSTYARALDPAHNAQCFAFYMPQITAATDTYQLCYNNSVNLANESENGLIKGEQSYIGQIDDYSNAICGSLQNCSTVTNTLTGTYECYNSAAGNTIETAGFVQNISKDRLRYVNNKLVNINYDLETRNAECSRAYTDEATGLYNQLEACLAGAPILTTTSSTTSSPETTTPVRDVDPTPLTA